MSRALLFVASVVLGAGLFVAAPAQACESHKKAKAELNETKAEKASSLSVSDELDHVIAGKCGCGSQADCTCKRNDCQCGKCLKQRKASEPLYESLKGARQSPNLENARHDASVGVFI